MAETRYSFGRLGPAGRQLGMTPKKGKSDGGLRRWEECRVKLVEGMSRGEKRETWEERGKGKKNKGKWFRVLKISNL